MGRNPLSVVEMGPAPHPAFPELTPGPQPTLSRDHPPPFLPSSPYQDFREKNMDYMRPDIVALLRGSDSSYVRELIGMDPVAVFRWAVLRAAIQAMAVLREAGRLRAERAEKAAGRRLPVSLSRRGCSESIAQYKVSSHLAHS